MDKEDSLEDVNVAGITFPAIFDSDKKQRFGISNNGEFIDNVYREQDPSFIMGKLIGRNQVQPHEKKQYTTADIVCETYLYKKGSWMQNWKKRYFVLRKDIRSLCYYDSRESLTLLGSIPLELETAVKVMPPREVDGYEHVIMMKGGLDDLEQNTYIRFDDPDLMRAWVEDICIEAVQLNGATVEAAKWWDATYSGISFLELKSNTVRREGLGSGARHKLSLASAPGTGTGTGTPTSASPRDPPSCPGRDAKICSPGQEAKKGMLNSLKGYESHSDDSDDERKQSAERVDKNANANAAAFAAGAARRSRTMASKGLKKRQYKLMKQEKQPGPAPFQEPTASNYLAGDALSGLQVSVRLCNVCAYQDKIFVVLFANTPKPAEEEEEAGAGTLAGGSKWTQLARTELRTVEDKPVYGENYVSEYCINFCLLAEAIPDNCRDVRVVVYRQENEMNVREPSKASNLAMQLEVAKSIIPRKMFESHHVIRVAMQVKVEVPMDIAVPLFKEAKVDLGIIKITSRTLARHREGLGTLGQPYAERLYSFVTTQGQTLSLEQLVASHYSVSVAQAFMNMGQLERNEHFFDTVGRLKAHLKVLSAGHKKHTGHTHTGVVGGVVGVVESIPILGAMGAMGAMGTVLGMDEHDSLVERTTASLLTVEDLHQESLEHSAIVLQTCSSGEAGKSINNVIEPSLGGGVLRRSTWKKYTGWQYCATNLNLHLLTSKHFTFPEMIAGMPEPEQPLDAFDNWRGAGAYQYGVCCTPTITVGVPAAHEMKFSDGGLRKLLHEVTDLHQRLKWMEAIQAPSLQGLHSLFAARPREAHSIFGRACVDLEDCGEVMKRKVDLARRIDMCGSQALGVAATAVRTICTLAAQYGGKFMDALARCLKIGFVVLFQSMLSTQGAELGMIEDLDMSAVWLSLVTVRLVVREEMGEMDDQDMDEEDSSIVGRGEGVSCQRDLTGRIILDIEVGESEGLAIAQAQRDMSQFDSRSMTPQDIPMSPLSFNRNPSVRCTNADRQYIVYATAELVGLVFTQGVNEMQTLANISASREVLRQVEINTATLARLEVYYKNYRAALLFQLEGKKPDILASIVSLKAPRPTSDRQLSFIERLSLVNTFTTPPPRLVPQRSFMRKRKSVTDVLTAANSTPVELEKRLGALAKKVANMNDRLFEQVRRAVAESARTPHEKHVDVLLSTSALCREMGGITAIMCKSGKDRTSMGVTLEHTRSLVEDLGVLGGQEVCSTMRFMGVRRMNVYANTGQSMFAFNQIQKIALPNCYRPPPGCHSGNVNS